MKITKHFFCLYVPIAFIAFGLISCNNNRCGGCYLTVQQQLFIKYQKNQKILFKNSTTAAIDTFECIDVENLMPSCYEPCNEEPGGMSAKLFSNKLAPFEVLVWASGNPSLFYEGNKDYSFFFDSPKQNVVFNGSTYNDVYIAQIDSSEISHSSDSLKIPWKIMYSENQGLLRFYMINGDVWNKQ